MKSYIFIYKLLIFLTFASQVFAQEDPLIDGLFDPDVTIRYETINTITKQHLEQYVPYIEDAIFGQEEPFMIYIYLNALKLLQSSNIISFAHEFIELSDNFTEMRPSEDPLVMKVKATLILLNAGDFTTLDFVFEIAERDRPNINPIALDALGRILLEVPGYSREAETELLFVLDNSTDENSRSLAMMYLNQYSSNQFIQNYVDIFVNNPDELLRVQALTYLFDLGYQDLHNLLLQRLSEDPHEVMRSIIADSLLAAYGEPLDLKSVIEYQPTEPDEDIKIWMQYLIGDFIPPKPVNEQLDTMIINLIGYTDELYQYEWIENEETYQYYVDRLTDLRESFDAKEWEAACSIINERILPHILEDLKEELITTEGYKFLHYHTVYISKRMEELLGNCK